MITFSVPSFLMGICYVFMGFSQQVPLSSPALFFVIPGPDRGSFVLVRVVLVRQEGDLP